MRLRVMERFKFDYLFVCLFVAVGDAEHDSFRMDSARCRAARPATTSTTRRAATARVRVDVAALLVISHCVAIRVCLQRHRFGQ